jgi:hypothetical protein
MTKAMIPAVCLVVSAAAGAPRHDAHAITKAAEGIAKHLVEWKRNTI